MSEGRVSTRFSLNSDDVSSVTQAYRRSDVAPVMCGRRHSLLYAL